MSKKNMQTQIISSDILEALSLQKRYNLLNINLMIMLNDNERNFLNEVQNFCVEFEKKNNIDHSEDIYSWFPAFGEKGYIHRVFNYEDIGIDYGKNFGIAMEFMRQLAVTEFDPSFNLTTGASTLCINPIKHHNEGREECQKPLKELITGKAVGCICITEPTKGSDATHLDTVAKRTKDGLVVSGTKCYNTNAPKSKYTVLYGTEDPSSSDSENKMSQSLIPLQDPTITVERVFIPSVPKVYLGKETYKETFVPNERILCDVGKGKFGLFEGLAVERMGIAIGALCLCWSALTHATIYSNMRKQFGQEVSKFQGVGFLLAEYYAKVSNLTLACLAFARGYDEAVVKHKGHLPDLLTQQYVMGASQLKYQATHLSERCCYEMSNIMGGNGLNDNTLMEDLLGLSRIQEIIGGSRQIQLYIMMGAIRKMWRFI